MILCQSKLKMKQRKHNKKWYICIVIFAIIIILFVKILTHVDNQLFEAISTIVKDNYLIIVDRVNVIVEYPLCVLTVKDAIIRVGDGECNGGRLNSEICGYDGGDCLEFNGKYPNCTVEITSFIGDEFCEGGEYNTAECGYDGGDCIEFNEMYPNCTVGYAPAIGNGFCQGEFNTAECGYDGGDCLEFHMKYPNCTVETPIFVGDGICDGGGDDYYFIDGYNTSECGYDGGDCLEN